MRTRHRSPVSLRPRARTPFAAPIRPSRPAFAPASPLYGYDYNPSWPSILSIAYDTTDGASLFLYTDRPCVLSGAALPLIVPVDGGHTGIIMAASTVLPYKFKLTMNAAVMSGGAPWQWLAAPSQLIDPISGHGPNAAAGNVDDVPGPYTPPPDAVVVGSNIGGGTLCTLIFDAPVPVYGGAATDGSILFDGAPPVSAAQSGPAAIEFTLASPVTTGSTWAIAAQPTYVGVPIAVPQSGTF